MSFTAEYDMYNDQEELEETIEALNTYIQYLRARIEKLEEENECLQERLWLTKEAYGDNSGYDSEDSEDSSFSVDVEEVDLG